MNLPASWAGRLASCSLSYPDAASSLKSAASQLEAPVVRAIRQQFGTGGDGTDPYAMVTPEMYGRLAEPLTNDHDTGFAEELARAMAQSKAQGHNEIARWRPPILQVLLDEVIVPQRPVHLDAPAGGYFCLGKEEGRETQPALG